MSSKADELAGELAPPMANGEVVFDEPWQGRTFGMARAMADAGFFTWNEFRAHLIDAIARWEHANAPTGAAVYQYYEHFQVALEELLAAKDLVGPASLHERTETLLARPVGHDHEHSQDHEH